ncbi:hypothetical protein FGG08_000961 [Glutinoglossum americanum]|uniref:Nephrocystin 3-like N-terminal domain-containing protein n=1 Tax=Glutinoglossum americanum TaxID=1670608 RepID=A0A9P8IEA6_9PEZI|nr:hypothetical protein FGG08_000961 [Glutinoglossum americanum]
MVVDRHSAIMKTNNNKNVELKTDHSHLNKFATKDSNYNLVAREIVDLISTSIRRYDADIKDCLESLGVDMKSHESLRAEISKPVAGTCDWVVREVEKFLQNLSDKKAASKALIFRGGPGSGKSVLSKFITEHIREKVGFNVKYIIFKEASPTTSQPTPAMLWLIYQLLSENHTLYRHIQKRHEQQSEWTLEILLDVFENMMADGASESTIIVIDALNECDNEPRTHGARRDFKPLKDFMDKLRHLDCGVTRHFIITTQQIDELSIGFPKRKTIDLEAREEVKLAVEAYINDQVNGFLNDYLEELQKAELPEGGESSEDEQGGRRRSDTRLLRFKSLRKGYEDLLPDLVAELTKKADHMFLWVYLFMDRLRRLQSTSPGDIRKELEGLPKGLISLYTEMFSRRQKDQSEAISQKLPWILFAQQPLTRDELRDALAMQSHRRNPTIPFHLCRTGNLEKDLSLNFGPLVTIEKTSSRVRLFHSSLRGALLGKSEPPCEKLMKICQPPEEEHAEIAFTCLDYLCLPQFTLREFETVNLSDPNPADETIPLLRKFPFLKESGLLDNFPFLKYAATSWAYHARRAGEDHPKVKKGLNQLIGLKENLELAFQIFIRSLPHVHGKDIDLPHKLSEWGLEKLAIAQIKAGNSFDQKNEFGNHLLHSAAWNGLLDLIKVLEENGVKLDMEDGIRQTALHHAAQTGQVETVKYLISKNLPLDSQGRYKWTPLHYAASGHHLDVITTLLDAGADARKTDRTSRTPRVQLCAVLDRDPVSRTSLGARLETVLDRLSLSEHDGSERGRPSEGSGSRNAVHEQNPEPEDVPRETSSDGSTPEPPETSG